MEPEDAELMQRAKAGDVAAFGEIVRRWREPLHRFFRALLADPSQADDCVQETFLRLWALRERYKPTGRFSSYLFQIGRHHGWNQCVRFTAERRWRAETRDEEHGLEIEAEDPSGQPEVALLERMEQARVRRAIAALPECYRSVFTLSHFEGLKYAQIAERLEIPVGTVKSRMFEAVRRLRATLAPEGEEK